MTATLFTLLVLVTVGCRGGAVDVIVHDDGSGVIVVEAYPEREVHDRLESEEDAFHDAIRAHYLAMAQGNPQRYLVVDGTLGPDEIHAQVVARLRGSGVLP